MYSDCLYSFKYFKEKSLFIRAKRNVRFVLIYDLNIRCFGLREYMFTIDSSTAFSLTLL